jgi:hypothetical protein
MAFCILKAAERPFSDFFFELPTLAWPAFQETLSHPLSNKSPGAAARS